MFASRIISIAQYIQGGPQKCRYFSLVIFLTKIRSPVWWPSAVIVNFQIEINITFQKRNTIVFQNFKTPFILM